jgi:NADPH2:quinone reductase
VSFDAGASLGTSGMAAYRALFTRGQARPGDRILVHGATGGVGAVAVQLAVSQGMVVVGTADDDAGATLVKSLGARHAFVHMKEGYFEHVRKHGPYDVVIESLANVNLGKDLEVVAPNGRIVIVGSRGKVEIDPRDAMIKEADVRGLFLTAQTPAQRAEAAAGLVAALEKVLLN